MKRFKRRANSIVAVADPGELSLMASLIEQLCELLGDGQDDVADDPFARWASEFDGAVDLDHTDPVVQRLFPDAYDNDEQGSAEFRRFTEEALRRGRLEAAHVVLNDLESSPGKSVQIPLDHTDTWVRTLNAVRLSLSVRLGIETEPDHDRLAALPADEPRAFVLGIYDWIGWILESLLEAQDD